MGDESSAPFRRGISVDEPYGSAVTLAAILIAVGAGVISVFWSVSVVWSNYAVAMVCVVLITLFAVGFIRRSALLMSVGVVVALLVVGCLIATSSGPVTAMWLIVAAFGAMALTSHYFSRRSLVVVMVIMLALVTAKTMRIGHAAMDEDRIQQARSGLIELMADRCAMSTQHSKTLAEAKAAADTDLKDAVEAAEKQLGLGPATPLAELLDAAVAGDEAALAQINAIVVPDPAEPEASVVKAGKAMTAAKEASDAAAEGAEVPELLTAARWISAAWPDGLEPAGKDLRCSLFTSSSGDALPRQDHDFELPADRFLPVGANDSAPRALAVNVAAAELEMAKARAAVASGDDATKAAAADVEAKQSALTSALGAIGTDATPVSMFDLLTTGANEVLTVLPGFGGPVVPAELTVAGWLVLAGLALIVLRLLTVHAVRGATGPVEIKADENEARLRAYISRNIPEPGSVPGAESIRPVTDLLAETGVPAATGIAKFLESIVAVLSAPTGYLVRFDAIGKAPTTTSDTSSTADSEGESHTESTATVAAPYGIGVVVTDARTKRQVDQQIVIAKDSSDPWRTAAYWAAATILDRSLDVPPWGTWDPHASSALSTFYSGDDLGRQASSDEVRRALREAPDNGLLLMQAAANADLAGDPVRSFLYALRAARRYPQYFIGRYRLAIQASALAVGIRHWSGADRDVQEEIQDLLAAIGTNEATAARTALHGHSTTAETTTQAALVAFGKERARAIKNDLALRRLVPGILRRRERGVTLELFGPVAESTSVRDRLLDLARSVEVIAQLRVDFYNGKPRSESPDTSPLVARARRPEAGWQLAYNVACLFAVRYETDHDINDREKAFELLRLALARAGSGKLTAAWLKMDPDLRSIATDARFSELLRRMGDDR